MDAPKFKWLGNGEIFTVAVKPTWAEIEWVERQARCDFDDLTGSQRNRAALLLSLRRGGVMLQWHDLDDSGPDQFEDVVEDVEDPTPTGAEAGTTTPRPSRREPSGGSSRRKSSASAPGSGTA